MKLEFRFSISPRPEFYATIRLAALSLRRLGAPYDTARLHVSVGDYADLASVRAANRWSEDFPVTWQMVSHARFAELSYFATHNSRYATPSDADVVVMSDSDLCVVRRMDDLLGRLAQDGCRRVAGLQAHGSPFVRAGERFGAAESEAEWRRVFARAELDEPRLTRRCSCDAADAMGRGPAYFNYALVAVSREAFAAVAPLDDGFCRLAYALTDGSHYMAQIGLSLMVAAAGLDVEWLPHAFNCANDDHPFEAPEDVRLRSTEDIRAIHFLRGTQVDRRAFLSDRGRYQAFLTASDLNRVNRRLRHHVLDIAQTDDPFFPQAEEPPLPFIPLRRRSMLPPRTDPGEAPGRG